MKTGKWRHELKYNISMAEYLGLRSCISEIMECDAYSVDGAYTVESIYFDNFNDRALKEKIFGVNEREKFRIRVYNGDLSFIRLEKKQKKDGRRPSFFLFLLEFLLRLPVLLSRGESLPRLSPGRSRGASSRRECPSPRPASPLPYRCRRSPFGLPRKAPSPERPGFPSPLRRSRLPQGPW